MRMGLVIAAVAAASLFAAPAFAGEAAQSSSEAIVTGASAGNSSVTVTASDKGDASVFGTTATSTNTATGNDTTKGFAEASFEAGGESAAEEASHF